MYIFSLLLYFLSYIAFVDRNGSFRLGSAATEFLCGSDNTALEFLRARNSDGQYHNLIASATGIKFESDNRGTRTTLWEAATKGDLPNVKIIDLDSVRFVNSSNGPQMAFYPGKNNDGAFFFNIHIQRKELEVTRYNGTDWETLFKIQGS